MAIRRKGLTDKGIKALKPRPMRYAVADPEMRGHYVRVMPTDVKSYVAVARDPYGKQVWTTIGAADLLKIEDARDKAREIIKRIKAGLPGIEPLPPKPQSFEAVAQDWLKRHVEKNKLRSADDIERILSKYVLPYWADRDFAGIKRTDITGLLDHVEDKHGARQADVVLAIVRGICNWYATRHDDYVSPVVRGMRRAAPASRERILDDDEIRAVWNQAESSGAFGAIVQLALLTAQRREKLASMRWADVVDGTWNVPAEDREKGTGGALVLPEIAVGIIRAQHHFAGNPYVFPGRGAGHFNGFSPCKRAFERHLPAMPQWGLHDLRRTARSLMSRAGVRPDIAERVLGHVIAGVEGVYDRHSYREEKADALRRLASLIESILHPPAGNVLPLARRSGGS
jgi:integrase